MARVNDEKKKYNKQLQKHKANWQATENQRRQQWIQEKSKSIKAMTIKGIEPEIQR